MDRATPPRRAGVAIVRRWEPPRAFAGSAASNCHAGPMRRWRRSN